VVAAAAAVAATRAAPSVLRISFAVPAARLWMIPPGRACGCAPFGRPRGACHGYGWRLACLAPAPAVAAAAREVLPVLSCDQTQRDGKGGVDTSRERIGILSRVSLIDRIHIDCFIDWGLLNDDGV
jgi:hypothetical protein